MFTRRESHKKSTRIILSLTLMLVLAVSMFAVPGARLRAEENHEEIMMGNPPVDAGTAGGGGDGENTPPAETFTVRFLGADDAVLAEHTDVAAGTALTPPEMTDETFAGWDSEGYLDVQSDLEIRAVFTPPVVMKDFGNDATEGLASVTTVSLSARPTGGGSDFEGNIWNYVGQPSYATYVTIVPSTGEGDRSVTVYAPTGMRFLPMDSIQGISKISYNATSGASACQRVTVTLEKNFTKPISFSLVTIQAGAATTVNSGTIALLVGNAIKAAAKAGEGRAQIVSSAVVTEDGIIQPTVYLKLTPKVYAEENIFTSMGGYLISSGILTAAQLSMNPKGVVGMVKTPGGGGNTAEKNLYYLHNETVHEPYWNLCLKVYLPDGITSSNATLKALIRDESDGKGRYIYIENFGENPLFSTTGLNCMTSPVADPIMYRYPGYAGDYARFGNGEMPFGMDLKLVLEDGLTATPLKTYIAKAPIEVSYTTWSNTYTNLLETVTIKTQNFLNVDNYNIGSTTFELPQDWTGDSGPDCKQTISIAPAATNSGRADINEEHIGGTVTFEPGPKYELYSMTIPRATGVVYYMENDATAHTPSVSASNSQCFIFDEAALPGNKVVKIVATFADGTKFSDIAVSLGARTESNLTDNTAEEGLYKSYIRITLRAEGGCQYLTDTAISSNARVSNGQHTRDVPVNLRRQLDNLMIHAYGQVPENTLSYDLLNDSSKSIVGAYLGFGYNTFSATGGYVSKTTNWMTYENVVINFASDEASKPMLSTLNGMISFPSAIAYTNGFFEFTTNLRSGSLAAGSNGDPFGVTGGAVQTFDLGLAANEYFTSLVFKADAFKVQAVSYDRFDSGASYFGYKGTGRVVLYSRSLRSYAAGAGNAIPDINSAEGKQVLNVSFSAVNGETKMSILRTDRPIGFLRAKEVPMRIADGYSNLYGECRHVYFASEVKVQQGKEFNATFTLRGFSNVTFRNYELWLKVNPNFVYVGNDPNIRVVEKEGETWLIVGEQTSLQAGTLSIRMMALPSCVPGNYQIFDGSYANFTGTCDPANGEIPPFTIPYIDDQSDRFSPESDPDDINGNGKTDELLFRIYDTPATVSLGQVTGVATMPGIGSAYNTGLLTQFRQNNSESLILYAGIGGENAVVTNYVTEFVIPSKGDVLDYSANGLNKQATAEFDLRMRGPVRLQASGISLTVEYKIGSGWFSETQVVNNGGWAAVESIRISIPEMPADVTIGAILDLSAADIDAAHEAKSFITGSYSYINSASDAISGRTNLSTYQFLRYKVSGSYIFQDTNGDEVFDVAGGSGDKKLSGVRVALYKAGADGKPSGSPVAFSTTDNNGAYGFSNLLAGDYVIQVILPDADTMAFARKGAAANASHVDANGVGPVFTVGGTADVTIAHNAGIQSRYTLTVEFRTKDGTLVDSSVETVRAGDSGTVTAGSAAYPIPANYRLADPSANEHSYTIVQGTPNVTLVFVVELESYTVTFDGNAPDARNIPAAIIVTRPDTTIGAMPAPPARIGYKFESWNTKSDGSGSVFGVNTPVNGNITVYAIWTHTPYLLSFNTNGANSPAPATQSLYYGSYATAVPIPVRARYVFEGWMWVDNATGRSLLWDFATTTMPEHHVVLVAQWRYVPQEEETDAVLYTLSFDLNGGSGAAPASQRLAAGALARPVANPTRQGYIFDGWNTAADGSGGVWNFQSSRMSQGDVMLYAQWVLQDAPIPPGPDPGPDPNPDPDPPGPGMIRVGNVEIALFGGDGNSWALLNLISSVAGVVVAILALLSLFRRNRGDEEEDSGEERKKHLGLRIASVAVAVISVFVFILTENMALPMVLVDRWSILMLVLFGGTILFGLLARDRYEKQEKNPKTRKAGAIAGK